MLQATVTPAQLACRKAGWGQGRAASVLISRKNGLLCVKAAVSAAEAPSEARQQQQVLPPLPTVLPESLRNNVAVLEAPNPDAPGAKTTVYVLGMSHVSQVSCDQIRELVRLVRPEVVAVELCRNRVGLLVDAEAPLESVPVWHTRKIMIGGLPTGPCWPTEEQLKSLLTCKPGQPISSRDIENDVVILLSTGLFASVRPFCESPGPQEAPAFSVAAGSTPPLRTVAPLGSIRYGVLERQLPPITQLSARLDSSLRSSNVSQDALDAVCQAAVAASQAAAEAAKAKFAAEAEDKDRNKDKKPEEAEVAEKERVKARDRGVNALPHYLSAKEELAKLFGETKVQVLFDGVEFGKAEAVVKAARPSDLPYLSGLEPSAVNGEGQGITPFRPNRPMFKVSDKMFVPTDIIERLRAQQREVQDEATGGPAAAATPAGAEEAAAVARRAFEASSHIECRSEFRPWTEEETKAKEPEVPAQPVPDALARLMTATYSKYQSVAARKVGLSSGAAWRAAMEAAAEVGTQQVLLADLPTNVTERKLADALVASAGARLLAAFGLVTGTIVAAAATDIVTPAVELGGLGVAVLASTAILWPVTGPFLEIAKFAGMTAPEIEAAVALREPIQGGDLSQPTKLFGEDALLDWPGALQPIIRDRDTYMARTLAAAATGREIAAPAFVLDRPAPSGRSSATQSQDAGGGGSQAVGGLFWRYMAPDGKAVPALAAPRGSGDAAFKPLRGPRAVVGIVGTAHVHGMCAEWQRALEDTSVDPLLKV